MNANAHLQNKNSTWQGSSDNVFNKDSAISIALVSLSISVLQK